MAELTLVSSKPYDRAGFDGADGSDADSLEISYFDTRLTEQTASLAHSGVTTVALRCAGFNNVDAGAAAQRCDQLRFGVREFGSSAKGDCGDDVVDELEDGFRHRRLRVCPVRRAR